MPTARPADVTSCFVLREAILVIPGPLVKGKALRGPEKWRSDDRTTEAKQFDVTKFDCSQRVVIQLWDHYDGVPFITTTRDKVTSVLSVPGIPTQPRLRKSLSVRRWHSLKVTEPMTS
jgi:hypothetical protein